MFTILLMMVYRLKALSSCRLASQHDIVAWSWGQAMLYMPQWMTASFTKYQQHLSTNFSDKNK